jgi:hypothetical protein
LFEYFDATKVLALWSSPSLFSIRFNVSGAWTEKLKKYWEVARCVLIFLFNEKATPELESRRYRLFGLGGNAKVNYQRQF